MDTGKLSDQNHLQNQCLQSALAQCISHKKKSPNPVAKCGLTWRYLCSNVYILHKLPRQSLVVHNIGISSSSVFPRQPVRCFVPPPFPLILLTISAIKTTFIPVTSTRKIAMLTCMLSARSSFTGAIRTLASASLPATNKLNWLIPSFLLSEAPYKWYNPIHLMGQFLGYAVHFFTNQFSLSYLPSSPIY